MSEKDEKIIGKFWAERMNGRDHFLVVEWQNAKGAKRLALSTGASVTMLPDGTYRIEPLGPIVRKCNP